MKTKQTIAIIGATGNMGSAISRSLAKGNYNLLLMSADTSALDNLVSEISKSAGASVKGITVPLI